MSCSAISTKLEREVGRLRAQIGESETLMAADMSKILLLIGALLVGGLLLPSVFGSLHSCCPRG